MVGEDKMLPAVYISADGGLVGAGFMNKKAYSKSLEQGVVWEYNPETGRVLPCEGELAVDRITNEGSFYKCSCRVSGGTASVQAAGSSGTNDSKHNSDTPVLEQLEGVLTERRDTRPEGSYTTHLFNEGEEKIRKKLGEEAVECILAAENSDLVSESADLVYHLMVLLTSRGQSIFHVLDELKKRF